MHGFHSRFLDDDDDVYFDDVHDTSFEDAEVAFNRGDLGGARVSLTEALNADDDLARAIAGEALSLIDAGLIDDACRRVATWLHPRWPSLSACQEAYAKAMGRAA